MSMFYVGNSVTFFGFLILLAYVAPNPESITTGIEDTYQTLTAILFQVGVNKS